MTALDLYFKKIWDRLEQDLDSDSESDDPVEIAEKIAKSKNDPFLEDLRQAEQQEYERMIQEEREYEIIQKQQRKKEREQEREYEKERQRKEKERQRKLDKSIEDDEFIKRLGLPNPSDDETEYSVINFSDSDDEPVEIAEELSEDSDWSELLSLLTNDRSTGENTSDEDLQEFIKDVIKEKNEKKEKIYTTKEYKKKKERSKNRLERRKQLSYINATEQDLDEDVNIDDVKDTLNLIAGLFYDAKNKFKETPKTEKKKYIKRKIKMNNAKIRFDLAKEDLRAYKNLKKKIPYKFSGTSL